MTGTNEHNSFTSVQIQTISIYPCFYLSNTVRKKSSYYVLNVYKSAYISIEIITEAKRSQEIAKWWQTNRILKSNGPKIDPWGTPVKIYTNLRANLRYTYQITCIINSSNVLVYIKGYIRKVWWNEGRNVVERWRLVCVGVSPAGWSLSHRLSCSAAQQGVMRHTSSGLVMEKRGMSELLLGKGWWGVRQEVRRQ